MSGRRVVLIVLGSIVTVLGLLVVAIGVGSLVAAGVADDDGFLESRTERLETPRNALVSEDISADAPRWVFGEDRFRLRVRAEASEPGRPIFLGVAPLDSLEQYLSGVGYDVLAEIDYPDFRVLYDPRPGDAQPQPPAQQGFWAASSVGTGEQVMDWDIESGTWAVVVMNADGARPVSVDASAGLRIGFLTPLGIGALVVGLILAGGGIAMIVLGARRRRGGGPGGRAPEPTSAPEGGVSPPEPPEAPPAP